MAERLTHHKFVAEPDVVKQRISKLEKLQKDYVFACLNAVFGVQNSKQIYSEKLSADKRIVLPVVVPLILSRERAFWLIDRFIVSLTKQG